MKTLIAPHTIYIREKLKIYLVTHSILRNESKSLKVDPTGLRSYHPLIYVTLSSKWSL